MDAENYCSPRAEVWKLHSPLTCMNELQKENLIEVGHFLNSVDFQFTAITPASHRRILERDGARFDEASEGESLPQLFGWNKKVRKSNFSEKSMRTFERAGIIEDHGDFIKSRVRFSTLNGHIFMHSGFPTESVDSVFFGPDSYRFVNFLTRKIESAKKIADIGAGSGVGALALAVEFERSGSSNPEIIMTDINKQALDFAEVNAGIAGHQNVRFMEANLLEGLPQGYDTLIANPPFIIDSKKRAYRHGGGQYGCEISVNILKQALEYLPSGGQLALYTGAPIVSGKDQLWHGLSEYLAFEDFTYEEIDPDIFGEELIQPEYKGVDRIAAVGLLVRV